MRAIVIRLGCLPVLVLTLITMPRCLTNPPALAIYQQKCARCHGKSGEGAKEYPQPLVGNRSLEQLTQYIARTMPEDAPGTCTGAEAEKVAAYIFDAFYSPAAQARIKAPTLQLARLTVNEYRNAVADLIGSFPAGKTASPAKRERPARRVFHHAAKRNLAFTRIDPEVRFDFRPAEPGFRQAQDAGDCRELAGLRRGPRHRACTTSSSAPSIRPGCGSTT